MPDEQPIEHDPRTDWEEWQQSYSAGEFDPGGIFEFIDAVVTWYHELMDTVLEFEEETGAAVHRAGCAWHNDQMCDCPRRGGHPNLVAG